MLLDDIWERRWEDYGAHERQWEGCFFRWGWAAIVRGMCLSAL